MKIKLSINKNIVNKNNPQAWGWENTEMTAEELAEHVCAGFAFSQGVLKKGASAKKPSISDIEFAQLVPIDIDNAMKEKIEGTRKQSERKKTIEEGFFPWDIACADPWLHEHALMLYTSPSHTEEHHRFRIIFALDEPIYDPLKFAKIAMALTEKFGGDPSCKNIDRMFFGSENAEVLIFGNCLSAEDVENVIAAPIEEQAEYTHYEQNGYNGNLSEEQVAAMLKFIPTQMSYDEWGKIVSAIGNYFDEDTAVRLIENWSPDEKQGTRYKIKHRSPKPQIASVIYYAEKYGFDKKQLYKNHSSIEVNPSGKLVRKKKNKDTPANEDDYFKTYSKTELGNSERFLDQYGNTIRYNHTSGKWLIWNGMYWEEDQKGHIMQLGKNVVKSILNEAFDIEQDEDKRKSLIAHALKSQSKPQISNMISLASTHENVAIIHADLDADLYLFNCQNGTYDLRSNTLKKHNPEQLLSKCAGAKYDPEANCYAFEAALDTMFSGNEETISFIQRALGLSLCGAHLEEKLFFCYGTGKNGKSVFFQVLNMVFGDYFQKAPTEMLMAKNQENIPNDIARLPGSRLVVTEELPENRSLNEQKIKNLTGGDSISARFLHQEFFDFFPSFTLFMFGNHKPIIRGSDEGIWRRVCLIPFTVTIPEEERKPQDVLMTEFEIEKDGILTWICEGWKKYQEMGLMPPDSITKATKEYRAENDVLADFISECCEINSSNKIKASELLKKYNEYCTETKDFTLTKKKFYGKVESIDGVKSKMGSGQQKYFEGIDLKENTQNQGRAFD